MTDHLPIDLPPAMRTCTVCLRELDPSEFSPNRFVRAGLQSYCRQCGRETQRRRRGVANATGATANPGERCAICHSDGGLRGLMLDHDHDTGAPRGWLCALCNTALGMFQDDPNLLRAAFRYLTDDYDDDD